MRGRDRSVRLSATSSASVLRSSHVVSGALGAVMSCISVIRCPSLFLPNVSVGHRLQASISVPNTLRHSLRSSSTSSLAGLSEIHLISEFKARLCWPSISTNLSSQHQRLLNSPTCRAYQPSSRAFLSWHLLRLPPPPTFRLARLRLRRLPQQPHLRLHLQPLLRHQEHRLHQRQRQPSAMLTSSSCMYNERILHLFVLTFAVP